MEANNKNRNFQKDLKDLFALRRDISNDLEITSGFLSAYYDRKRTEKIIKILILSAAIIVICFWSFGPSLMTPNSDQLFSDFYTRFDPDILTRDLDNKTELDYGITAYKEGHNSQALDIFRKIETVHGQSQGVLFFKSLALLDLGNLEEAYKIFSVLEKQDGFMISEIYWYMALIKLKSADYESVRKYLKALKLIDPKSHNRDIRKIKRRIRLR